MLTSPHPPPFKFSPFNMIDDSIVRQQHITEISQDIEEWHQQWWSTSPGPPPDTPNVGGVSWDGRWKLSLRRNLKKSCNMISYHQNHPNMDGWMDPSVYYGVSLCVDTSILYHSKQLNNHMNVCIIMDLKKEAYF